VARTHEPIPSECAYVMCVTNKKGVTSQIITLTD